MSTRGGRTARLQTPCNSPCVFLCLLSAVLFSPFLSSFGSLALFPAHSLASPASSNIALLVALESMGGGDTARAGAKQGETESEDLADYNDINFWKPRPTWFKKA